MGVQLYESIGLLSRPSVRGNSINHGVGDSMLEDKTNRSEPNDGIFAIPAPKHVPNYNMAELFYYCKKHNIKPMDLTKEEKKKFILPTE
ncbi:hypothetical protein COE52_22430 [Bacillus thuringiensis]|uniref:hypothetical protein n=1 Tax=Bacillus thuringiensis TaxID=1428 RepID=UPI000BFD0A57|nr:hypothetical protein [Bacillus thuringiensis]MCU5358902.1 hypothetical protein [Bacillus cereus]PGZ37467.1 hypothetical protein COE52_22430 [Bacillus thuringiensis]